jgi:hypothetical protein
MAMTKMAKASVVDGDHVDLPHVMLALKFNLTFYNGTLLEFCTNTFVNAKPNKQLKMSGAQLELPRILKALLLQHAMVGRNNMVETWKLS